MTQTIVTKYYSTIKSKNFTVYDIDGVEYYKVKDFIDYEEDREEKIYNFIMGLNTKHVKYIDVNEETIYDEEPPQHLWYNKKTWVDILVTWEGILERLAYNGEQN